MMNLFSIFDPSTQILHLPFNWMSILIPLLMWPASFWLSPSRTQLIIFSLITTLKTEFLTLLGKNKSNNITAMMLTLFLFIMINNSMGLLPYIFTATSHLTLTISFALPLWTALMLYGWINHTMHMLAHLVPQGTPPALTFFMVLIETTSNMIRPLTLSIRLAANMIAGHLLLTLLGNQGPQSPTLMMPMILTTQILLLTLESAVALIQAYVFSVLITLYISESTYDN